MSAIEIFAMFAGLGIMVTGIGIAVFLINKSREVHLNIETNGNPADVAQGVADSLNRRMRDRGFSREPLWSYEETTITYEPKAKSPKGQIKTDPPKPEHTTPPKEET